MKKWYWAIPVVGILIACGSSGNKATDTDVDNLNKAAKANPSASVKSEPVSSILTAGAWKVGTKQNLESKTIVPGTYVISTPKDGTLCYWRRVKNFDGELESIIANGNVEPGASVYVTVKKADKGLILEYECLATLEK